MHTSIFSSRSFFSFFNPWETVFKTFAIKGQIKKLQIKEDNRVLSYFIAIFTVRYIILTWRTKVLRGAYYVSCFNFFFRDLHKLRWHYFSFFWPLTSLRWNFLWYKCWQKVNIFGPLTYLVLKRSLWTTLWLKLAFYQVAFEGMLFYSNDFLQQSQLKQFCEMRYEYHTLN